MNESCAHILYTCYVGHFLAIVTAPPYQNERTQAVQEVQTFKGELTQRREDFKYAQELQNLTIQEESAASRLSYERLLADKRLVDNRLEETEASGPRNGLQNRDFGSKQQPPMYATIWT